MYLCAYGFAYNSRISRGSYNILAGTCSRHAWLPIPAIILQLPWKKKFLKICPILSCNVSIATGSQLDCILLPAGRAQACMYTRTMHHMYGGSQPDSERTHPPSKGKLPCTLHVAPTHSAKCGKLRLYRSSELLGRRDAINQIESSLRRRTERRVSHKQLSTDSSTVVTYSPPQNISIIF